MAMTPSGINPLPSDLQSSAVITSLPHSDTFAFDEKLSDPLAQGMGVDQQFEALVEACHILGIRVVMEFVLRTAARDSSLVEEHPDWFYWIYEKYENSFSKPLFSPQQLDHIKNVPTLAQDFIAPDKKYRSMFSAPPQGKIEKKKNK